MRGDALVADIGGTKIAAARVSRSGHISGYIQTGTPACGGEAVADTVLELWRQIRGSGIGIAGVSAPGLAYPDGCVWAPNLPGWKRMPLKTLLEEHLRIPVLVESDRNAFVTGESWMGIARGYRNLIFLVLGTGVGAGILVDGSILRGHAELAGCAGWMAVQDRFLPEFASCGCLESLASGAGIGRTARQRFGREISARELVQMARHGNRKAILLLEEAGHHLGLGLANLVSILNPEMIVVGGGLSFAGKLLLNPAREAMKKWGQPLAVRQVRVVRSRLGTQAGLLGAAKLAFDSYDRQ